MSMSQLLLQQKNTFVHIEDKTGRKSLRKTKTEPLEFAPEINDEASTAASEHSDAECMDFPTPIQAFQAESKQPLFLPRMDSKFFTVPHSAQDLRHSMMSISTISSTGRNAGRSSSGLTTRTSMDFTGRSSMDFTGRSSMDFIGRNSISSTGRHSQIMSPSGRCDRLSRFAKDKEESQKTTVMIRNIPCRCTQPELLEEIEEVTPGVNFLYLPASRKREGTLGYAFVNFLSPQLAVQFIRDFQHHEFTKQPNSNKRADVGYALLQGFKDNVRFYRRSKVSKSDNRPYINRNKSGRSKVQIAE